VLPRYDVTGLIADSGAGRVTGVRLRDRSNSGEVALNADLVVDASGRSSRVPEWLERLGYPAPAEERVPIDIGYTTCRYRFGPDALGGSIVIVRASTPAEPRGMVVQVLEDGQGLVSVIGVLGDYPPTDRAGFRQFAAKVPLPEVQRVLREAEPLGTPVGFRFAASVRRRYERLARFPAGLLVLGDAVCSFNPVYAQGMSVAALQALALREELRHEGEPQPRRYFRAIGRVVDVPWQMAVGGDLAFAGVPGRRTLVTKLLNRYLSRLHSAVARDPALGVAFIRVVFLLDSPPGLLRPDRALRVLLRGRRPFV
jgi:2-polyprenyl-6-methoxyphenol hydroxylase-like FAD-dependent oxidoreductase